MLVPTWTATNSPHAAPAIASPTRSRRWAAFLTRNCIVVIRQAEDIKLRALSCCAEGPTRELPRQTGGNGRLPAIHKLNRRGPVRPAGRFLIRHARDISQAFSMRPTEAPRRQTQNLPPSLT